MYARASAAALAVLFLALPGFAGEPIIVAMAPQIPALTPPPPPLPAKIQEAAPLPSCLADCCQDDCCDCQPGCWYFQAEALALTRSTAGNTPIVLSDATGATLLGTNDIGFNYRLGPRFLLGRRASDLGGWEASYFGTQFWNASASVFSANNLDIPGPLVAVADDFDNADRMVATYNSELHNAEFNLVRNLATWQLLGGFRYFGLNERFNLHSNDSDGDVSDYTIRTTTSLYGGQLGARALGQNGQWGWDATAKAGAFGGALTQRQILRDNGNTFLLRNSGGHVVSAAFITDFNLAGRYQINDTWSLRGGYFVMYVVGAAVAPAQLDFTFTGTSGQHVGRSDILFHGGFGGVEAWW